MIGHRATKSAVIGTRRQSDQKKYVQVCSVVEIYIIPDNYRSAFQTETRNKTLICCICRACLENSEFGRMISRVEEAKHRKIEKKLQINEGSYSGLGNGSDDDSDDYFDTEEYREIEARLTKKTANANADAHPSGACTSFDSAVSGLPEASDAMEWNREDSDILLHAAWNISRPAGDSNLSMDVDANNSRTKVRTYFFNNCNTGLI